jgi:hypothetical protein
MFLKMEPFLDTYNVNTNLPLPHSKFFTAMLYECQVLCFERNMGKRKEQQLINKREKNEKNISIRLRRTQKSC